MRFVLCGIHVEAGVIKTDGSQGETGSLPKQAGDVFGPSLTKNQNLYSMRTRPRTFWIEEFLDLLSLPYKQKRDSSEAEQGCHKPKVTGSNPVPATRPSQ